MGFLKKLVGGSDPGRRPDSGGGRAFIPSDDSNEQILSCVLSYIWLAEMGEGKRGRKLPKNDNVGRRTTAELEALQRFRRSRGYSYRQLENAFWCSDFVRAYHGGSTPEKAKFLAGPSNALFLEYVNSGRARRPRVEADGVVYYLTTIAFELMGVDVERYLQRN